MTLNSQSIAGFQSVAEKVLKYGLSNAEKSSLKSQASVALQVLMKTDDIDTLQKSANTALSILNEHPGLVSLDPLYGVASSISTTSPEIAALIVSSPAVKHEIEKTYSPNSGERNFAQNATTFLQASLGKDQVRMEQSFGKLAPDFFKVTTTKDGVLQTDINDKYFNRRRNPLGVLHDVLKANSDFASRFKSHLSQLSTMHSDNRHLADELARGPAQARLAIANKVVGLDLQGISLIAGQQEQRQEQPPAPKSSS